MDISHMRGGRMIGKGTYGCVFDPPLICRGDKEPKGGFKKGKLGKFTAMDDLANEFLAAKLFEKKPESKKYFILPEMNTLCDVGEHGESALNIDSQKEKDIHKCDSVVEKAGMSHMLHYQLEYGGKTLQEKLSDIQIAVKEFPFFKFMNGLLEIGAYLLLNGIVHNDLHAANIMMNKSYHPRLIDFGRCYLEKQISQKVLDNLAAEYDASLGQITPECTTQDGLESGVEFNMIMQDLIEKKPGLLAAERIFGQSRQEQIANFRNFWKSSKAIQDNDYVRFWKLYWPAVDAWSIGHDLASTLIKLSMSDTFMTSKTFKEKFPVLKAVITGLLKVSPRERLDCLEALALYDPSNALVVGEAGKSWLSKKQAKREKTNAKAKTI